MSKKRYTKRLPIRVELRDDENDALVISANLFMRRDALLIEFPASDGHRLGAVKLEHHNGVVNLVYWDDSATQMRDAGNVIPLFEVELPTESE